MRAYWLLVSAAAALAWGQDLPRGQIVDEVKCVAYPNQSYALYLPSNYSPERAWSVIFAFSPEARGRIPVERFQVAAEMYGYIVAGSNNSRNGPWNPSMAAAHAMWNDVVSRFSIDERRVYATGFSGGSRVAMGLAMQTGKIAGVIAASAGFPDVKPRKSVPFAIFETAGTDDFNNLEMREVDRQLTTPHRLAIFEGGHEWPPIALTTEAVEWLEIRAMVTGLRKRDEMLIDRIFEARKARLTTPPGALSEYQALNSLAADFEGLRDVSSFTARAAQLQVSKGFREASKKARDEEHRERLQLKELEQLEAGLGGDPTVRESSLEQLNFRLTALSRQARAPEDSGERQLARRLLGSVPVESRDVRDADFQELLARLRPQGDSGPKR
jgi:hypothetical protein